MSVVLMIMIIIIRNEIAIPTIIMMIMMTSQPAPQQSGKNPHRLYCTAFLEHLDITDALVIPGIVATFALRGVGGVTLLLILAILFGNIFASL